MAIVVVRRYPIVVILLRNSCNGSSSLRLSMLVAYLTWVVLLVVRLLLMQPGWFRLVVVLVGEDML